MEVASLILAERASTAAFLLSRTFALGIDFTSENKKCLPARRQKDTQKIISAHLGRIYAFAPAVFGNRHILAEIVPLVKRKFRRCFIYCIFSNVLRFLELLYKNILTSEVECVKLAVRFNALNLLRYN
jgi:hypothetical protein